MFYDMLSRRVSRRWMACALAAMALLGAGVVSAVITDLGEIAKVHQSVAEHADQGDLNGLPADERFIEAFELGDELFATSFNALDGGEPTSDADNASPAFRVPTSTDPGSGAITFPSE